MDMQSFCRACLESSPILSIFTNGILQKLKICGGIKAEGNENKTFPNMICQACFNNLEIAYEFRKICQASEKKLIEGIKSMVIEIKNREDIKNMKIELLHPKEEPVENPMHVIFDPTSRETDFTSEFENAELTNVHTEIDVVEATAEDLDAVTEDVCSDSKTKLKNNTSDEDTDSTINTKSTTYNESKSLKTDIKPIIKVKQKCTKRIKTKSDAPKTKKEKNIKIPGKAIYACEFCGLSYVTKFSMQNHMRLHSVRLKFVCEICGDSYAGKFQLEHHMCSAHTGERNFKCDHCEKAFFSKRLKKNHQRRSHSKIYKCQQCDKSFGRSDSFKQHLRVHTGEKPVVCDKCGTRFKELHHLRNHYKSITPCVLKMSIK